VAAGADSLGSAALVSGNATAQILVDGSAFDAIGVGGNWQLRRPRRSFGAPDANRYRGFESFLARQDTGCKLSAEKTMTPLNAMFCGVFRVNLLTSTTPQMSYLRSYGPFLSKPPDFANLVRFFQAVVLR
jgi:hypothetical protein